MQQAGSEIHMDKSSGDIIWLVVFLIAVVGAIVLGIGTGIRRSASPLLAVIAWLAMVLGGGFAAYFFLKDASVASGLGDDRIVNTGLVADRLNGLIAGIAIFAMGFLT